MRTFDEYNEEIKVESVLKLSLTGPVLASAQKLQKKISDPDSYYFQEKIYTLHSLLDPGGRKKKIGFNYLFQNQISESILMIRYRRLRKERALPGTSE